MAGDITVADPGLVCWWEFDGNAEDSSEYENHGVENGDPVYVSGYHGQAIGLDGIDDHVICSLGQQETWSAYTVAMWVRTDTLGQDLYSSVFNNNSEGNDFQINVDDADNYQYRGSANQAFGAVTTNWVHLAVTCDGVETTLYFNGGAVATIAAADTDFGQFAVGTNRNTANWFAGTIDDVRVYNRALSSEEIRALAPSGESLLLWPDDGAVLERTSVLLEWQRGLYAADTNGHEVFLSDDFEAVESGDPAASLGVTSNEFYYVEELAGGRDYYWRVHDVNDLQAGSPWKSEIRSFTVPEATAWSPVPHDGARFMDLNVTLSWKTGMGGNENDVYFGDSQNDVSNGTGGTFLGRQAETTFNSTAELWDTAYYWRIDTVKTDGEVVGGPVWSFTTRPVIPIVDPNLVGWWKMDDAASGTAVDFSGYDNDAIFKGDPLWVVGHEGDALRFDGVDDWLAVRNLHYESAGLEQLTVAAWIRTAQSGNQTIASFDRSEYWRLEVNGSGGGAGEIGFSVMTDAGQVDMGSTSRIDDDQWHHVAAIFDKGTIDIYIDGRADAQVVTGTAFGTGMTRYGFIGARSEAGTFDGNIGSANPFAGDLDDVRIYHRALSATEIRSLSLRAEATHTSPADGAAYSGTTVTFTWWPGKYAQRQNVYFGTDPENLSLLAENLAPDADSYGPVGVELGKTCYWRVDAVDDSNVWESNIWTFHVTDHLVIDDFDSYASTSGPDEPALLNTWRDGGTNGTGATISLEAEFVGSSIKCAYDNSQSPFYSETDLTYDDAVDWTAGGVKALALRLRGDAGNTGEAIYVAVEDADGRRASVTYGDSDALVEETWNAFNVALQDFAEGDVDLTRVKKLIVGVSGSDATGTLFVDDIRLYPPRCIPEYAIASLNDDCVTDLEDLQTILQYWLASDYDVAAAEPDSTRLQAHYKFDETSGTIAGDSSGRGFDAIVDPNGADAWDAAGIDGYCLAFDATFGVTVPEEVFAAIDSELTVSVWVYADKDVNPNTAGRVDFGAGPVEADEPWDRVAWVQEKPATHLGRWNHYAFVKHAGEGMMRIYHNGIVTAQNTDAPLTIDGAAAGPSRIGAELDSSGALEGKLDDFRVYGYALSQAEVLYLALGSGSQLHQPLIPVFAPADPYTDGTISLKDIALLGQWWLRESLWP
jgi:hypothetical protein